MAYVFGIEGVPVFEMLFIMMGLLLLGLILSSAGLLFVLMELRKLTKLISQEKLDIMRFEQDLGEFEKGQGKSSDQILEHIKKAMTGGMSRAQIEYSLYSKGWTRPQVDRLFSKIDKELIDKKTVPG